jgi:hypothetical protein
MVIGLPDAKSILQRSMDRTTTGDAYEAAVPGFFGT